MGQQGVREVADPRHDGHKWGATMDRVSVNKQVNAADSFTNDLAFGQLPEPHLKLF